MIITTFPRCLLDSRSQSALWKKLSIYEVFFASYSSCLSFSSASSCLSSSSALHFSNYSFPIHHLTNQDDLHLLAHAKASLTSQSNSSVSKREQLVFYLWIKLHALIPTRSLPTQF
jgi:hypothetical protein